MYTKIQKKYSNGVIHTYNTPCSFPNRSQLSDKERNILDKKNAIRQKKNRARETFNSSPEPFNYFFTITSGIPEIRQNPKLLKEEVASFLKSQDVVYFFVIERNNSDIQFNDDIYSNPSEYHIHGVTNKPINLNIWGSRHLCNPKALYQEPIRNLDSVINYLIKDCINLPTKIRFYQASYKRKKASTTIITDDAKQINSDRIAHSNNKKKASPVIHTTKKSARYVKIYKGILKFVFNKIKYILKKIISFKEKLKNTSNNKEFYSDRYNVDAIIRRKMLGHEPSLSELNVLTKHRIEGGDRNEL